MDSQHLVIHSSAKIVVDTNSANSVMYARTQRTGFFCPVQETGAEKMSISRFVPPLDYLRAASTTSLQSFELSRLNHAANLRREIAALIDQWVQETSEATLARYLLDHHASLHDLPNPPAEPISTFLEPAINPLPDIKAPSAEIVPVPPKFSDARQRVTGPKARKPQRQKRTAVG